jgi:hypothetical protein
MPYRATLLSGQNGVRSTLVRPGGRYDLRARSSPRINNADRCLLQRDIQYDVVHHRWKEDFWWLASPLLTGNYVPVTDY